MTSSTSRRTSRSMDRRRRGRTRRAAASAVVVAVLAGLVVAGPAGATEFPDVPDDHPFAEPIAWAVEQGVTTGYDDGTFRPTVPVSRQAFAAFLARYDDGGSGSEPEACEGDGPFEDVAASHPFCAEISWLVDLGITTGFGDGTFRPTDAISRQAMAAFLARYAADEEPEACEDDGPFDDVPASHPFCAEITWMVDQGITTGFDDNTFRPTAPISRQAAAAFLWRLPFPPLPPAGDTVRVSVRSDGIQGNLASFDNDVSADGQVVVFASAAQNLEPGHSPGRTHIYVHDRQSGTTARASNSSDGTAGNANSITPSISADGRYVAFQSAATNLVPDDTNDVWDVFVHDRETGVTERVSVSSDGDEGDNWSRHGVLSADGRFVAFTSLATNLVPGDTNDVSDVFVHDRDTGETERVSVSSEGVQGNNNSSLPNISDDGRVVAFATGAANLAPGGGGFVSYVALHDRETGETERLSVSTAGAGASAVTQRPALSADGSVAAFTTDWPDLVEGESNGERHVFVRDRTSGVTTQVSLATDGTQADGESRRVELSADGRFVAFESDATDLVADDTNDVTDVFVHDRQSGTTERMSVSGEGTEGDGASRMGGISADGAVVSFHSDAKNLIFEVTNRYTQVFVRLRFDLD